MFTPKISIVIPVYNGANYMREAIDSALNQTYKNIEIIVVNDGSKDDGETDRIARSYGDKIRYFLKENGGSSSALNVGIANMTGDYFSWLSHDDVYEKTRTEKMVHKIIPEEKDTQVIICSSRLIDAEGKPILRPPSHKEGVYDGKGMFELFRKGRRINGCGILVPRKLMETVGRFDEKLRYVNDVDYWYRLMIAGCKFTCFDEPLVLTRIHGKQVTVTHSALLTKESKYLAEKIFTKLLENKEKNKPLLDIYIKKAAIDGNIDVIRKFLPTMTEHMGRKLRIWMQTYCFFFYGKGIRVVKKVYKKIFYKR